MSVYWVECVDKGDKPARDQREPSYRSWRRITRRRARALHRTLAAQGKRVTVYKESGPTYGLSTWGRTDEFENS